MEKFSFVKVDSFADFIMQNKAEYIIRAVNNGFSMNISDADDLTLAEAASDIREL